MQKWEYYTETSNVPLTWRELDSYGANGWELTSQILFNGKVYTAFKRPVAS